MTPFALAIRDEGFDLLRLQKNELIQKMPNTQLHTVDLKLLVSCSSLWSFWYLLIPSQYY